MSRGRRKTRSAEDIWYRSAIRQIGPDAKDRVIAAPFKATASEKGTHNNTAAPKKKLKIKGRAGTPRLERIMNEEGKKPFCPSA